MNANPTGGASVVEFRTTDQKRFLSNRNCLLTLLKNAQHVLLLAVVPLTLLLLVGGVGRQPAAAPVVVCQGRFSGRDA